MDGARARADTEIPGVARNDGVIDGGTASPEQGADSTVAAVRAAGALAEAVGIMAQLRGPDGCPWDREQTFDSIKQYTLEETYEVFDAIERRAWPELKDELGDLLLQVLFYAQIAAEAGYFDIADVAAGLNAKLVRRHPHIFGDGSAADAEAVLRNWEEIKQAEKRAAGAEVSGLDGVPRTMPAMLEAGKLGSRAAKVGFDWPDVEGLFAKVQEEIAELRVEVGAAEARPQGLRPTLSLGSYGTAEAVPLSKTASSAGAESEADISEVSNAVALSGSRENLAAVEEEMGDLLFTVVNLARHLKVDTESALRGANAKFRGRFGAMERAAGGFEALGRLTPDELEGLWDAAKRETQPHVRREAV
jgi:XTP/dITP diphosphohydrolase/ATP diphosphatase